VRLCPKCGGSLEVIYDYEKLKNLSHSKIPISQEHLGVWRYLPLLPVSPDVQIVTLGEGGTLVHPLKKTEDSRTKLRIRNIFVKDEFRNPTASFKDRNSTVSITRASHEGYKRAVAVTAGNAGSSIAAFSAKAGIDSWVFTMKGISDAKLAKLLAYGAKVFATEAETAELISFARQVIQKYGREETLLVQSRYNPYAREGSKTALFEIYEHFAGKMPDWIAIPIGSGSNLTAYHKGIKELQELGLITNSPKLIGVQGALCAPVVEAFEKNLDHTERVANPSTIAHSIKDDWAPEGDSALAAIRKTHGQAVGVTDEEIVDAQSFLSSKEGLFVEPASAAPLAGVKKLIAENKIDSNESVLTIATGFGLNQPEVVLSPNLWKNRTIRLDTLSVEKFASSLEKSRSI